MLLVASAAHALTPMQMMQKALSVQQQVNDYTATVTVSINAPNVQIPSRSMNVYFKRPDKLHVESEGIAVVPRDALLMGNLAKHLEDNTQATLAGTGTLSGRPVWCIKLTPRDAEIATGRMLCWIDTERYVLLRTEVWDGAHKAMTVNFSYSVVQQRYWMPSQIQCEVASGALGDRHQQS